MAELSGETIKNAIARELNEIFPDIAVYKEEQSNPYDFPNFFILQLSANTTEDRKDHYFQTYLYNVRYRQVADVETEARIEQKLDNVGLQLITNFVSIQLDNRPHKIRNVNYEKVDKVIHFTFQVRVQVEKEPIEKVKMLRLKQNYNISSENYGINDEFNLYTSNYLMKYKHSDLNSITNGELSKYNTGGI